MTPGDDEARIRAALAEAHRDDRTPPFDSMWARAGRTRRAHSPARRWVVLSAGLAAAAAVGVWLVARPRPATGWHPTGTRWIGPTDFLLETPDLVTLRTLPSLDPTADPLVSPPPARRGLP
jgi:hypothetical protein